VFAIRIAHSDTLCIFYLPFSYLFFILSWVVVSQRCVHEFDRTCFFRCEFVLRHKGVKFVRDLLSKYPNLNRPTIRNARKEYTPGAFESALSRMRLSRTGSCRSAAQSLYSPATIQAPSQRLVAADYVHTPTHARQPHAAPALSQSEIDQVQEMGFSIDDIRGAVER